MTTDGVCMACKTGFHSECTLFFSGMLGDGQECCCAGAFTLDDMELLRSAAEGVVPPPTTPGGALSRRILDPGYVHPDAWRFSKSIGEFTDPLSTGRKLVAEMYKISPGMVCEWAGKENCGGGVTPIMGCIGNPASDLHHGPDKNTLNNAKASWGVGDTENIHLICSFCHNRWHALNDPTYAHYDRVADQKLPWVPSKGEWTAHNPSEADEDALWAENRLRAAQRKAKGNNGRGRGAEGTRHAADVEGVEED